MVWTDLTKDEEVKFLDSDRCYECGKKFPTSHLLKSANAHEKEHKGFRRALTKCPEHNYGATVLFKRDCEF